MMVFSDPFPVTNGVKQGCVLAPTLFSMMFSAMLTAAFQDSDNGIPIRCRIDGKLFNLRKLSSIYRLLNIPESGNGKRQTLFMHV